jgi:hypothetical protein
VLDYFKKHYHQRERNRASLLAKTMKQNINFFESRSSVDQLALLIAHIREVGSMVNALARFALQISDQSPQVVSTTVH